jgi:hypothetical protein
MSKDKLSNINVIVEKNVLKENFYSAMIKYFDESNLKNTSTAFQKELVNYYF